MGERAASRLPASDISASEPDRVQETNFLTPSALGIGILELPKEGCPLEMDKSDSGSDSDEIPIIFPHQKRPMNALKTLHSIRIWFMNNPAFTICQGSERTNLLFLIIPYYSHYFPISV